MAIALSHRNAESSDLLLVGKLSGPLRARLINYAFALANTESPHSAYEPFRRNYYV
jgi:hypothetical protein